MGLPLFRSLARFDAAGLNITLGLRRLVGNRLSVRLYDRSGSRVAGRRSFAQIPATAHPRDRKSPGLRRHDAIIKERHKAERENGL
jgi:hypothetical protein